MSSVLDIYVISNSDLFREGLNAIAAFCNSHGFKSMVYVGSAIGVLMTIMAYMKQHDLMVYLKWVATYFLIFNVILGLKETVAIINTSDASIPAELVDNVPIGIAIPAHLITMLGYGFGQALDEVFHSPDSLQYNKTGMLFGSNLFHLSLATSLDDPDTMNEMNAYMRSCVVGDLLINHKYTLKALLNAPDLWGILSSHPSPIRGIELDGQFKTCVEAARDLTTKINHYASQDALNILAKFVPSHKIYSSVALSHLLTQSYQGLLGLSESATDILKQNMSINAFRSGITNYAAETGSIGGLQNFANTVAMQNTRMAWASSSHMGVETLPLMQVVLLLLMLCLFPLIVVLAQIPGLGMGVLKNYIYTLIWLESWPILFTILNMAINFYLAPSPSGTAHPVTLSNINLLAQEQSDIAGVAGYLILAIPFLSIGIVRGMASTFNQAAQYLGGMLHSIGQSASSAVAMGNYSLGNVSTANATANSLNANKYDTNFSTMHGLDTEQLANASTLTYTPTGQMVSQIHGAMSQLATSINASQSVSSALLKSADHYQQEAKTQQHSYDQALSSATTHALSYDHAASNMSGTTDSYSSNQSAQVDHAFSNMKSIAHDVAEREGISESEAYRKLTQASLRENLGFDTHGSVWGKALSATTGISGGINASSSQDAQSAHDQNDRHDVDHTISARALNDFRDSMNTVQSYSKMHGTNQATNQSSALASKVGSDLREAQTAMFRQAADYAKGERLSQQANYVKTHADVIQSNFNQAFAAYVHHIDPTHANQILNNTSSSSIAMQRQSLAENFMHLYSQHLEQQFSSEQSQVQPTANYQHDSGVVQQRKVGISQTDREKKTDIRGQAKHAHDLTLNPTINQTLNTQEDVETQLNSIRDVISTSTTLDNQKVTHQTQSDTNQIKKSAARDKKGIIEHWIETEN